jgi:hypothetical protein
MSVCRQTTHPVLQARQGWYICNFSPAVHAVEQVPAGESLSKHTEELAKKFEEYDVPTDGGWLLAVEKEGLLHVCLTSSACTTRKLHLHPCASSFTGFYSQPLPLVKVQALIRHDWFQPGHCAVVTKGNPSDAMRAIWLALSLAKSWDLKARE